VVAKVQKDVTHVVFKDGSPKNYEKAASQDVFIVSPLWVQEYCHD